MTAFCFAMSIGLVAVLSSAGKRYTVSASGIMLGILTWVAVLVVGVLLMSQCLSRVVCRIRREQVPPERPRQRSGAGLILVIPNLKAFALARAEP